MLVSLSGNVNYNEASISHSFDVVKNNQYLTFNPLDAKTFGDASFVLADSSQLRMARRSVHQYYNGRKS